MLSRNSFSDARIIRSSGERRAPSRVSRRMTIPGMRRLRRSQAKNASGLAARLAGSSGTANAGCVTSMTGNLRPSAVVANTRARLSPPSSTGGERLHQEIAVGPGRDRDPARTPRQQAERLDRVLVAVLGVDGLAGCELDHAAGDVDLLPPTAHQMHLDPAPLAVVERPVAERIEIEIGAKLTIEAREHIEVELRGHALGVVIGGIENADVLDEIDADDEGRTSAQDAAGITQERNRNMRLEIADRRAREEPGPCQTHYRARQPEWQGNVGRHRQDPQAWIVMLQLLRLLS